MSIDWDAREYPGYQPAQLEARRGSREGGVDSGHIFSYADECILDSGLFDLMIIWVRAFLNHATVCVYV